MQHIDAYFTYVHPVSYHAFIHKQSFYKSMSSTTESRSRVLLLSMCAIASPWLSNEATAVEQSAAWASEGRQLLFADINRPTTTALAACLLLVLKASSRLERATVWTLSGVTARMAYALQLNVEEKNAGRTPLETQIRRRLMWAVFCLDKLVCRGHAEFQHVRSSSVSTCLPCGEELFTEDVSRDLSDCIHKSLHNLKLINPPGVLHQHAILGAS